ncbi:NUMOD4 domain-containing protein [Streptococcus ictaluri]|uniref:HNH nuclease domain-containing protein n=1 Tax=Streptococcus ictaluri 707-05 TaxID=764299 RepID=G5K5K8_9STRE|nr:NUMOD4 domain-containing protein [Streptococcus ictaluri]EHI69001.1 hypothetical protein STRIC_2124 [Streptococcus ictaluri 707-05]
MEEWRTVKGYEGVYEISNTGKIRSLDRLITCSDGRNVFYKGIELKYSLNKDGYCVVALCKNGTQKSAHIHRLVAEAFIKKNRQNLEVNHIDENKENNNAKNLEWVTRKENCNHGTRTERSQKNRTYENVRKIPVRKLDLSGNVINEYSSISEAVKEFNGYIIVVSRVVNGKRKTAYGYKWEAI